MLAYGLMLAVVGLALSWASRAILHIPSVGDPFSFGIVLVLTTVSALQARNQENAVAGI